MLYSQKPAMDDSELSALVASCYVANRVYAATLLAQEDSSSEHWNVYIRKLLGDGSFRVRREACVAIIHAKAEVFAIELLRLASEDASGSVRLWAVQGLRVFAHPAWRALALQLRGVRRLSPYESADRDLLVEAALEHTGGYSSTVNAMFSGLDQVESGE